MTTIGIEAVEVSKNRYVGSVSIGDIVKLMPHIDMNHYNFGEDKGYQREEITRKVNAIATGILRSRQTDHIPPVTLSIDNANVVNGIINVEEDTVIHVPDGQHRLLGAKKAYEVAATNLTTEDFNNLMKLQIPFITFKDRPEHECAILFLAQNRYATPVRRDVIEVGLDKFYRQAPAETKAKYDFLFDAEMQDWQRDAHAMLRDLTSDTDAFWYHTIKYPNNKVAGAKIGPSAVIDSLKPFYHDTRLRSHKLSRAQRVKILNSFWDCVRQITGEEFFDTSRLNGLTSVTGFRALHAVMTEAAGQESNRHDPDDLANPALYEKYLKPVILEMEGTSKSGEKVKGLDFWTGGADGAIGQYAGAGNAMGLVRRAKAMAGLSG